MSSNAKGYGAVASQGSLERGPSYDVDNMYYVKERILSGKERLQKILLIAIPILAAFLIMGGAAFFLFRDFGHLYPGSGGGRNDDSSVIRPSRNHSSKTQKGPTVPPPIVHTNDDTTTSSSSSSKKSPPLAACADNPNCNQLGLVGMCCPTSQGVMLGCC